MRINASKKCPIKKPCPLDGGVRFCWLAPGPVPGVSPAITMAGLYLALGFIRGFVKLVSPVNIYPPLADYLQVRHEF